MSTPTPSPSPSGTAPPPGGDPNPSPSDSDDPTPSPSPQAPADPDAHPPPDASAKRPSDARRKKELAELKTPPPDANGKFDVKPSHVFYTSYRVRDGQFDFDKDATALVSDSSYQQAAGKGAGADAFAETYDKVAKRFLEVWAKSVISVGGVAVGLTETANNYAAADWFSNQKMYGPPPRRSPPAVISKAPEYGPVATLKWTGTGDNSSLAAAALGEIPDFIAGVIRPAIEHGLNLGRTHEITPGANEDELTKVATAWRESGTAARKASRYFTSYIDYLTDNGNSEWQGAMNTFCQSIWGASAWGVKRGTPEHDWRTNATVSPRGRRPIIEVLHETSLAVEKGCHDVRDAAKKCREITERLAIEATKATVKDLTVGLDPWELLRLGATFAFGEIVATFRSHMDQAGCNAAVDAYHEACHAAAEDLKKTLSGLDEAYLSAPTFRAEAARAQGFGARSLNEFKKEHTWTVPGESANDHKYPIDLANSEWMNGSHTHDKHVGKTDEQLVQRLRDDLNKGPTKDWPHGKPKISRSSTFPDADRAQMLTQHCIDKREREIQNWLDGPPTPGAREEFSIERTPDGDPSGRAASKQDYKTEGMKTKAEDVTGVKIRLRYDDDLEPPFVVETSMPARINK